MPTVHTAAAQLARAPDTLRDVEMSLPPEGIYTTFDALYEASQDYLCHVDTPLRSLRVERRRVASEGRSTCHVIAPTK